MNPGIFVGIIGDFQPDRSSHIATDQALRHAAAKLSVSLDMTWIPTRELQDQGPEQTIGRFDAILCGPGSPYQSLTGALEGIRFCREKDRPFLGT